MIPRPYPGPPTFSVAGGELEQRKCPSCGAPLPSGFGEITCPYCGGVFAPKVPPPPPLLPPPPVPDYEFPDHVQYSVPVARPRWPGAVAAVFVFLFFVLPMLMFATSIPQASTPPANVLPGTCTGTIFVDPTASPISGVAPLTVDFQPGVSDSYTVYYSWDFGDGNSSVLPYPTETFHSAGAYDVVLGVSDSAGNCGSGDVFVYVNA